MSSNLLTLAKWLPACIVEHECHFAKCRTLKCVCFKLLDDLVLVSDDVNKCLDMKICPAEPTQQTGLLIEKMESIASTLEQIVNAFEDCFHDLQILNVHSLLLRKIHVYKDALRKICLQICYILNDFVSFISYMFSTDRENILASTLRILNSYNALLAIDKKNAFAKNSNSSSVCNNNTCPYLMFPLKSISVRRLLDILSTRRAEPCCHNLIDGLLQTYKSNDTLDDENSSSDNSSVEIYMALTRHISPPAHQIKQTNCRDGSKTPKNNVDEDMHSFAKLENLLSNEEAIVLEFLKTTQAISPGVFGRGKMNNSISDKNKISKTVLKQAMHYYEEVLWTEVGNYLEHVVLWWAACPLSDRPARSTQHLRDWLNTFVATADIPSVISPALISLADALGVYVTSTLWDQCFQRTLVASRTCGNPHTGQLFSCVLQELVSLCNLCEVTPDWILGAPVNELPFVEQIPILHRLDHTIHTTRLWSINESRKMANNWNVRAFFTVTHNDVLNCLSHLNDLRLANHTTATETAFLSEHVEVCALMRAKLVSEVEINKEKLKDSPRECVACLATICKVINLANLQMMFPPKALWKVNRDDIPIKPSPYVAKYLDKMLTPVLRYTDNDAICNMILTLLCESWLDHIYNHKIKFSRFGAFQVLCDFAHVDTWIQECTFITKNMKAELTKNEVLRRCEGVGRLLLRCPGEKLKMVDAKLSKTPEAGEATYHQQMPAEMYVPNQEQWLELKAERQKHGFNSVC